MREAMKTYARSPVHSLCALCPSPPKDQLTKTANLETQSGKSSQKHPGYMREAIKTYARRTVHSLRNLCPSSPRNHLAKLLPWKPKGTSGQNCPGICPKLYEHCIMMRIARLTACATCALHLDTGIYNQKSILQFLPTSQVL